MRFPQTAPATATEGAKSKIGEEKIEIAISSQPKEEKKKGHGKERVGGAFRYRDLGMRGSCR